MPRRRRRALGDWFELPALPFLSIMLGMLSVMALISLALTAAARSEQERQQGVELVGIPAGFRAFHVRCSQEKISWQQPDGSWKSFGELGFSGMLSDTNTYHPEILNALQFRASMIEKTFDNRELSYRNQQNTMIIWVEPDGGRMALTLRYVIDQWQLPLRVGMLPIFPGEAIHAVQ